MGILESMIFHFHSCLAFRASIHRSKAWFKIKSRCYHCESRIEPRSPFAWPYKVEYGDATRPTTVSLGPRRPTTSPVYHSCGSFIIIIIIIIVILRSNTWARVCLSFLSKYMRECVDGLTIWNMITVSELVLLRREKGRPFACIYLIYSKEPNPDVHAFSFGFLPFSLSLQAFFSCLSCSPTILWSVV